jgi:hypothetical protein
MRITSIALLAAGVLSSIAAVINGAPDIWQTPAAYLGQAPPSTIPVVFAPGKLADPGTFVMGRVAFSSDGREFYYTQSDSWNSSEHMTGDGWTPPQPFLDEPFGVSDHMPTATGHVYVGSDPSPEDRGHGSTYAFSRLSMEGGTLRVTSLGRPLNGPGFNGDFFIAPDESYMIVSAKETKDFASELHIAFRRGDGTWTAPVSLGPAINDGLAHRWGQYVSPDRKYLFYSHGTSEKDCAVYWVRFDTLLARLKPR